MIDLFTPESVRALIAIANSRADAIDGGGYDAELLRDLAAALSASLEREHADLPMTPLVTLLDYIGRIVVLSSAIGLVCIVVVAICDGLFR